MTHQLANPFAIAQCNFTQRLDEAADVVLLVAELFRCLGEGLLFLLAVTRDRQQRSKRFGRRNSRLDIRLRLRVIWLACGLHNWLGSGMHTGKQLGHLVAGLRLVSGMQGFFDLFMTSGDFPVIPDAVGTEPEIHYEDSGSIHTKWITKRS
ncbi:hypothetical protein B1L08_05870 [Aeromonas veronii]|nr:hypothetical protein [Aeromonas veronii]